MTVDERPRAQRRERQSNVDGGRSIRRELTITAEEDARLRERAAAARVTVPRLLVESALADAGETATARTELRTELFRARRLMAAVSNNVNQIAKATNATGEVQADLTDTLARVRAVADRLDAALTKLGVGR